MIITLSGITGVGKSYYKKMITQELQVQNMVIYTTRSKRTEEVDGIDKHFVTDDYINENLNKGNLFVAYDFLGEKYAYGSQYLEENINSVTELHYEWILDFKKRAKDVYAIYIVPNDIEKAKEELLKRGLSHEVYEKRIKEIEEHQKRINQDEELKNAFDIVFYNNYDEESKNKMLQLVKNTLKQ